MGHSILIIVWHLLAHGDPYHDLGYLYGFALQQRSLPFETSEEAIDLARSIFQRFPARTRTPTSPS